MTAKQFYIGITIFLIIEYIFILFILPNFYIIESGKTLLFVPLAVIFLGILQFYLLEKKIEKSKENFIVPFMLIFGGKFVFLLFATLLYVLYISGNNNEFVVIFFTNYFLSIILTVSGLTHLLKNK